jgi:Na+-transporting NADH:ubiquinone oxidoreductase subunit C
VADVNKSSYTIVFATVSCVICSVLLSGASVLLKDLQDKNKKIDQQRNVLMAANLAGPDTSAEDIEQWFAKNEEGHSDIKTIVINTETGLSDDSVAIEAYKKKPKNFPKNKLIYECVKEGSECVILPVTGVGLWGKMYGFLALQSNGDDVLGISFFNHKETPGLGAEITEPWFKDQFKGKKLLKTPGDFSSYHGVEVRKGIKVQNLPEKDQPYCVDGISGATITSDGVTKIFTKYVTKNYLPYFKNKK